MEFKFSDIVEINPKESLSKGTVARKIGLQDIPEYSRNILSFSYEPYNGGTKFRNGDTLFVRISPSLENGKTAQVSILNDGELAFGSTEYYVFRAKKDLVLSDFVYFLSRWDFIVDTAIKSMTGTTGRQRVRKSVFDQIKINLPSVTDQEKIVKILNAYDKKIETNIKIIANLEAQAQALFKYYFVDFEPFADGKFVESDLGTIPEGWEISNLEKIANYKNGVAIKKFPPKDKDNSLPALKIRELNKNSTDESSDVVGNYIDESVKVYDGDVIFSWSGTLLVKIWTGGEAGLNQHLFKVTSEKYDKWFYYLWTLYHLEKFISIARDKATTMGHIKRSHLKESKVLICDEKTYKNASDVINPIIELIINLGIQNRTLAEARDALLPKLMTGEIDLEGLGGSDD